jgi:hypothetical protein
VKIDWRTVNAIHLPSITMATGKTDLNRDIKKNPNTRFHAVRREILEWLQPFERDLASASLIGVGGIHVPVAHHCPALLKRGSHSFAHVLGPRCGHEQRFRLGQEMQVIGLQ